MRIKLNYHQFLSWLLGPYGQMTLIPKPEITVWMHERGYYYPRDWEVIYNEATDDDFQYYAIEFATEEMAEMFLLRWS